MSTEDRYHKIARQVLKGFLAEEARGCKKDSAYYSFFGEYREEGNSDQILAYCAEEIDFDIFEREEMDKLFEALSDVCKQVSESM